LRRGGTFLQVWCPLFHIGKRARLSGLEPGESLGNECIDKCSDIMMDVLGYVESITAQGREHLIYHMLSVKELPYVDASGAQAKTATGIGVEENGPVVKLLPKKDEMVGYGSFVVFHGMASPLAMAPHSADLAEDIRRLAAI
jgi:hypothetical protein